MTQYILQPFSIEVRFTSSGSTLAKQPLWCGNLYASTRIQFDSYILRLRLYRHINCLSYILRGSGTNPQYPCRFSLQGWSFLRPRGCILRKTAKVKFKRGAESHASFFVTPAAMRFSSLLSVIYIDSLICLSSGNTSFVHFIDLFGKAATSPTR